jgi:glutaminyl-peptide cyclotransferase
MIPFKKITTIAIVAIGFTACNTNKTSEQTTDTPQQTALVKAATFNADSAFSYVKKQVDFGPRVPTTPAHTKCGDYLVAKLKQFGCTVIEQKFVATTYNGTKINARNIIGSLYPQASKRILLASHWDSRPIADADATQPTGPVDGANDGASGVGVLLELVRTLSQAQSPPNVGVDIIFFDVEDGGNSALAKDEYSGFCLGSQYWAANKHTPNYSAYYGVLLDMVGAKNATFLREGHSLQYANEVTNNIWNLASRMGLNRFFIAQDGGSITDDHVPVNKIGKIPMVDIIHTELNNPNQTFFGAWHTHQDDMRNIDPVTLGAVGQLLVQLLYQEGAAQ